MSTSVFIYNNDPNLGKYLPKGENYDDYIKTKNFFSLLSDIGGRYYSKTMKTYLYTYNEIFTTKDLKERKDIEKKLDETFNLYQRYLVEYKEHREKVMEKLDRYPIPKYYEITLESDKLELLVKSLKKAFSKVVLETLLEVFTNNDYGFNSYDVIGLKDSLDSLPNNIILIKENNEINFTFNTNKEKQEFMQTGFYDLPGPICYADIRDIEKIYKFPFSSHINSI